MEGFYFRIPERQKENVKNLSERTGLTASELMRRLIDASTHPVVFNLIVPSMSGQQIRN